MFISIILSIYRTRFGGLFRDKKSWEDDVVWGAYLTLSLPKANVNKPRKFLNPELFNETWSFVVRNLELPQTPAVSPSRDISCSNSSCWRKQLLRNLSFNHCFLRGGGVGVGGLGGWSTEFTCKFNPHHISWRRTGSVCCAL